tara:strand:+ start:563 stop:817 length:255 start_codon:yes stop_codon:yes gene_type:complete
MTNHFTKTDYDNFAGIFKKQKDFDPWSALRGTDQDAIHDLMNDVIKIFTKDNPHFNNTAFKHSIKPHTDWWVHFLAGVGHNQGH